MLANDSLAGAIDHHLLAANQTPYYHWDEIRHRSAPDHLTREDWWAVMKLARRTMARRVPLLDVRGRHFTYALPDDVLRENEFVSINTGGHISLSEEVTNPATRDRYLVSSLIEEAITSSQLEGARTEKRVATEMIRSGREPRDRSERMILNNYHAMEFVGEIRSEILTPDIICHIHRIATEGTLDTPDAAGRFQSPAVPRVGVYDNTGELLHEPPPAEQLPERMRRLCDFANGADGGGYLPGVVRAIIIHFMMGYDHPFEDGNGRTARLLFYWSMLNQGYWLTEFISISSVIKKSHAQYGRAYLFTESDESDLTYFLLFNLKVLHQAIDALNLYLERKMAEVRELRTRLRRDAGRFNTRQLALLHNALKNPGATYSVQSHRASHRVSAETARQDLIELEKHGLLEKVRVDKRFMYHPARDLNEAIKGLES
ncbi:Fic family protein [Sphaerisporangium rubeum]|uniref:Fic family protein n=1 Tax=Sphaerisporangium rubeum TaxID=321317 RepID=A0A7X0II07_9ACTN|nr:Fic family protein [Sphaerisporangium rubeum]MBB6475537.1 Fic family protein [Sphaerisporangium rubeum]